jgi:uncharacterized protein Usg
MADLEKQLISQYRLTTAEILYHLPDYPKLIQTYIWQDYDFAPKFPELMAFLGFWEGNIDGKLHSVYVASKKLVTPGEMRLCGHEVTIQ